MKCNKIGWKIPIPNTTSWIRNVLTVYTYLSFLAIYPLSIHALLFPIDGAPQGFMIILLLPIAMLITGSYAFLTKIPKGKRKWGVLGLVIFLLLMRVGLFISFRAYLLIGLPLLITAFATGLLGFISPIVWVILGFRRQLEGETC